MVKRIDSLTDEQRATFPEWEAEWLRRGLLTGSLTEAEWTQVYDAARRVAAFSKFGTPIVVPARSPLAAFIAAPVALCVASALQDSGVRSGVDSGVYSGVRSGVYWLDELLSQYAGWLHRPILDGLKLAQNWGSSYRGGNHWAGWYSFGSWFRDVGGLELQGDLWERFTADERLAVAGPQSWHQVNGLTAVAVSDRPLEIHTDAEGRSHQEAGPAIVYADGWCVNVWHGINLPDDFFTWDVERTLAERNSEVRRCGIERLGWENVTDRLTLVASAPDPGNAPHEIKLYDLPADMADMFDEAARILVVQNASLDKGGHRRVFGLPVPAEHSDPVAAAAALFDVPPAAYAQLERAS